MTPNPYIFIVIFVGVALVFPLIPLAMAWLWRRVFQPPKPGAQKNAIYECGVESIGEAQIQFRKQYYLYAIIFLIFDVEAIFLVPFAVENQKNDRVEIILRPELNLRLADRFDPAFVDRIFFDTRFWRLKESSP